jgi:hypothetical protein
MLANQGMQVIQHRLAHLAAVDQVHIVTRQCLCVARQQRVLVSPATNEPRDDMHDAEGTPAPAWCRRWSFGPILLERQDIRFIGAPLPRR